MKKKRKLSSIQILRIFCIHILALFVLIGIWGRSILKDVNMNRVMEMSFYDVEKDNENTPLYSKNYNQGLKEIDKKISSLQELIECSEHALVVTLDKYDISGNGLLASVTVEKVIKSETLTEKEQIQIYDLILYTSFNYENPTAVSNVEYVESNLPLKKGDRYVVFIQKTINPVEKGSYMYASLRYGCFRITDNPKVYTGYDSYEEKMVLKEAQNYDVIYIDEKIDEIEMKLYQEIYNTYK